MAIVNFNLFGFSFQQGLAHLRASFDAAAAALAREVTAAHDAVKAYVQFVEAGGEEIGEWDYDGTRIWDQEQVLEFEAETMESAAMALRNAFAVAIYHHWERMARIWTGANPDAGHAELVKQTLARGYTIDPGLERVRYLANLLKHDKKNWAEKLHAGWPEILPRLPALAHRRSGWSEAVKLSED